MRSVLYFRLSGIAAARSMQSSLQALPVAPVHIGGPWFIQRDDQPMEGLPRAASRQTTYREEWAIAGTVIGAILAVAATLHLGTSAGTFASVLACVASGALGGLCGAWLAGQLGARILRGKVARERAQLAQGEMLLVASCAGDAKDSVKRMIHELGGVSVEEHSDVMPGFRWA
ncbi:hypothetical protein [Cupriavidus basilensis]